MDIRGNLTTNIFLSSLSNSNSVSKVNSQASSLVEKSAERDDTPSLKVRPLTEVASKIRDINDSVSLLQSLENSYASLSNRVDNISFLALRATNEELDNEQRASLNDRAQELTERLFDEANDFSFNGAPLTQQDDSLSFQIVANEDGNVQLSVLDMESLFNASNIDALDLSSVEKAEESVSILEDLKTNITQITDDLAQSSDRLGDFISTLSFTEKANQSQLSASFDSVIAQDVAAFIQEQLKRSDSVYIQLEQENEKRQILGLLKS